MEGRRGDPHPGRVALHVVSKAWPARREKPRRGLQLPFSLGGRFAGCCASGFLMTRTPYFGSYRRFGRQQTLNFRVFSPKYRPHPPVTQRASDQHVTRYFLALAYTVTTLPRITAARQWPPFNGRHETSRGNLRGVDHRIVSFIHRQAIIPHRFLRHRVGHRRFPAPIKRRPPPIESWVAGGAESVPK